MSRSVFSSNCGVEACLCPLCGEENESAAELRSHYSAFHLHYAPYWCSYCHERYSGKVELRYHCKQEHPRHPEQINCQPKLKLEEKLNRLLRHRALSECHSSALSFTDGRTSASPITEAGGGRAAIFEDANNRLSPPHNVEQQRQETVASPTPVGSAFVLQLNNGTVSPSSSNQMNYFGDRMVGFPETVLPERQSESPDTIQIHAIQRVFEANDSVASGRPSSSRKKRRKTTTSVSALQSAIEDIRNAAQRDGIPSATLSTYCAQRLRQSPAYVAADVRSQSLARQRMRQFAYLKRKTSRVPSSLQQPRKRRAPTTISAVTPKTANTFATVNKWEYEQSDFTNDNVN